MDLKNLNLDHLFNGRSQWFLLAVGFTLIGVLGILDYLSGPELSLSVFYLLPISLVMWYAGYRFGILILLSSIVIWIVADFMIGHTYSTPFILVWNLIVRLSFFSITTSLLAQLKLRLEKEQKLARTDSLTEAANHRYFYLLSELEIARAHRNGFPFTVAYLDMDDFKLVNDKFGHHTGDRVLSELVNVLKKKLRKTDIIARLGGDEFAILFPDTGEDAASVILKKLDQLIRTGLGKVQPVSCSIGAVTYIQPPISVDEMLKDVDRVMYYAKMSGKDQYIHEIAFSPETKGIYKTK